MLVAWHRILYTEPSGLNPLLPTLITNSYPHVPRRPCGRPTQRTGSSQRPRLPRGIQLVSPPPGKRPFDYFLPDGRTIEIKLDLRSQARHYAAIERPTLDRNADFYIHTLCYYLVFSGNVYRDLYNKRGKVPERKGAMGDQNYEGRLIPTSEMRQAGMYGDQWSAS
jgi:hypothetical protein